MHILDPFWAGQLGIEYLLLGVGLVLLTWGWRREVQ